MKADKMVEVFQFAFTKKFAKGIDLHTWQLEGGTISSFKTRSILKKDFQHLALQNGLKVLGATNNGKPIFS